MDLQKTINLFEIFDDGRNKKLIQNMKLYATMSKISQNPILIQKMMFHNMITSLSPHPDIKKIYDKVLTPQERRLKHLSSEQNNH